MGDARSGRDAGLASLVIDSVEALPADMGTVLVRVAGQWSAPAPEGLKTAVLVVREGGREYRLAALPETSEAASRVAPEQRPFRATFSVPRELEASVGGELTLDLGVGTIELSGLRAGPAAEAAGAPATEAVVIDRAVLAERRARRAELSEEAAARRATEAEQALGTLEAELAKLELRLGEAREERREVERQLQGRVRELRAADQRAHAEQQLREEAQQEGAERVRRSETAAAELRERLRRSDTRARELADEVEAVRRRAAEAQQAVATEQAGRHRPERDTASHASERESAGDEPRKDELDHALAAARVARLELDTLRRELRLAGATSEPRAGREEESAPAPPGLFEPTLLERERRAGETLVRPDELARARAEAQERAQALAAAEQWIDEARAAVADVHARLEAERRERALAEQELQTRWEQQYGALAAQLSQLEQRAGEVQAELDAERHARAALESQLAAERQRATEAEASAAAATELAARLERELLERGSAQQQLQQALDERRAELEGMRGELREQVAALDHERRRAEARAEGAELALAQRYQEIEQRANTEAELRDRLARQAAEFESDARRVEDTVNRLSAQLAEVQGTVQEQAWRADATEQIAAESIETSRAALSEAERRIADAQHAASDLQRQLDYQRAERELAEGELRERLAHESEAFERRIAALELELRTQSQRADAERDAAARWAQACARLERELEGPGEEPLPTPPAQEPAASPDDPPARRRGERSTAADEYARYMPSAERVAPAEPRRPDRPETPADAEEPSAPAQPQARRAPSRPSAPQEQERASWLTRALPELARDDPVAAAGLAIELLRAQALAVSGRLDYDVVSEEVGCYQVTIDARRAKIVKRREPRSRSEVDFRIEADAAGLVQMLIGGGTWRLRMRGVRVRATRRRGQALRLLPPTPLRLAELARASIWPDPGHLLRALSYAIDPAWTRGHHFTIEQEIAGREGGTWYVLVNDGKRILVTEDRPAGGPTASVRASQATFQHLLDGESPPPEEKAAMKGDPRALALFTHWIERARRRDEPPA